MRMRMHIYNIYLYCVWVKCMFVSFVYLSSTYIFITEASARVCIYLCVSECAFVAGTIVQINNRQQQRQRTTQTNWIEAFWCIIESHRQRCWTTTTTPFSTMHIAMPSLFTAARCQSYNGPQNRWHGNSIYYYCFFHFFISVNRSMFSTLQTFRWL